MKTTPTRIVEYSSPRFETGSGTVSSDAEEKRVSPTRIGGVDDGPERANNYKSRDFKFDINFLPRTSFFSLSLSRSVVSLSFRARIRSRFLSSNGSYTKSRSPLDYTPRINMYRHDCRTSIRSGCESDRRSLNACSPAWNACFVITGSRSRLVSPKRARGPSARTVRFFA